jgi:ferric iron reductase protein FhuF
MSAAAGRADPGQLSRALADTAAVGPFFVLATGAQCRAWPLAAQQYLAGLGDAVTAAGQRLGTSQERVAASIMQLGYAARLWSPVLGCALLHGIVPDLADLRVEFGPPVRLGVPEPTGWQVTPAGGQEAEPALGAARTAALSYHAVVEQHLEPLARGIPVKIAKGLLLGNAASALTGALGELARARPGLGPAARALAAELLDTGLLRGSGDLTGSGLEFLRRSCCLYYRVPGGGLCGDCPLPERVAG